MRIENDLYEAFLELVSAACGTAAQLLQESCDVHYVLVHKEHSIEATFAGLIPSTSMATQVL